MDRISIIDKLVQDLKRNKVAAAFINYNQKIKSIGVIEPKFRELILISLSVSNQCELCIAHHVKSAVEHGATRDEIIEASMQAVVMGGAPKMMYMTIVYEELEKYL